MPAIFGMVGVKFFIGENLLEQEILGDQKIVVEALVDKGLLKVLTSSLGIKEYMLLKAKYGLGDGETEGILLCKEHGYYLITDDNKARKHAATELGTIMVRGTLFLLKKCVLAGKMTEELAYETLELMKTCGAFLPDFPEKYFNSE